MTEKTHTIELKESELKGLIMLINRAQITGQEADSIVYLKQILSKPFVVQNGKEDK